MIDCVSREAVANMAYIRYDVEGIGKWVVDLDDIRKLPAVNPERPKGEWIIDDNPDEWDTYIHTCPFCDYEQAGGNFCTYCGADMREENDEE